MSTYICASCKETFKKGWSDEEAKAEAEEAFGGPMPPGEGEIVCDTCYRLIMQVASEKGWPKQWNKPKE